MSEPLDRDLAALRAQLHADASLAAEVNDDAAALRHIRETVPLVVKAPRSRRWPTVAVIGVAAACLAAVVFVVSGRHDRVRTVTEATSMSSSSTTIDEPTAGFTVSDVVFVDDDHGWVRTTDGALLSTIDGGATWNALLAAPLPGADLMTWASGNTMTFANPSDGWIVNNALWSTHDGGNTWGAVTLDDDRAVEGVAAAGEHVYLFVTDGADGLSVLRSPAHNDDFSPVDGVTFSRYAGGGEQLDIPVAAQGDTTWLGHAAIAFAGSARIRGDEVDANWAPPAAGLGDAIRMSAAPEGGPLYASGVTGVHGEGPMQSQAFVSHDLGETFQPVTLPPAAIVDGTTGAGVFGGLVAIDANTVGAWASNDLYVSADEGATWELRTTLPDGTDVRWLHGQVLIATDAAGRLIRSADGGITWNQSGTSITVAQDGPAVTTDATTDDTVPFNQPSRPTGRIETARFFDPDRGYVVTSQPDVAEMTLWITNDGATWRARALPNAEAHSVTMADTTNGWAIGGGEWWSTHDAAATWTRLSATNQPAAVEVSDGWVYVLTYVDGSSTPQVALQRSPVDRDAFADTGLVFDKGPGGNDVAASIATQGARVFIAWNDRGATAARLVDSAPDADWNAPSEGRGGNITFTAAPDGGPLYAWSYTGIWGGDAVPTLVLQSSSDGGDTFTDVPVPPGVGDAAVDGGSLMQLTAVDANTVIAQVSLPRPLMVVSYVSHDDGTTWTALTTVPEGIGQLHAARGVVYGIVSTDAEALLWVSTDGGANWNAAAGSKLVVD